MDDAGAASSGEYGKAGGLVGRRRSRHGYRLPSEMDDREAISLPVNGTLLLIQEGEDNLVKVLRPLEGEHVGRTWTLNQVEFGAGDAIGKLPPIEAGETHERDPLHQACSLSPINLDRIKVSVPGGSWRDWDEHLIAECHKRSSGKKYSSIEG